MALVICTENLIPGVAVMSVAGASGREPSHGCLPPFAVAVDAPAVHGRKRLHRQKQELGFHAASSRLGSFASADRFTAGMGSSIGSPNRRLPMAMSTTASAVSLPSIAMSG